VRLFAFGSGTAADPWIIKTRAELEAMLDTVALRAGSFKLGADIDLSKYSWDALGINLGSNYTDVVFCGSLDGADYAIKNATMDRSIYHKGGLFVGLENATIKDLALQGVRATTGGGVFGALAGQATGTSTISKVAVTGLDLNGGQDTGGLLGIAGTSSGGSSTDTTHFVVISCCFVQGTMKGLGTYRNGGLLGSIGRNAKVSDCFASVAITEATSRQTGGLVGELDGYGTIARCFASGPVSSSGQCGGLIGEAENIRTGLTQSLTDSIAMTSTSGTSSSTIPHSQRIFASTTDSASYYLNPATGNYAYASMTVDGATPTAAPTDARYGADLTAVGFKTQTSACYANWDFSTVWTMTANGPTLRDMPLGGGSKGASSIDVLPWD
jgi:hypothetical protein